MLKEVKTIQNFEILSTLSAFPNQAIIWGIIDGVNAGHILEISNNQAIVIIEEHPEYPLIFVAGELNQDSVDSVIKFCSKFSYPLIYCDPHWHSLFLSRGWRFHLRIDFEIKESPSYHLSEGLKIVKIDNMDLLERCLDFENMSRNYITAERFLEFGRGYVLCKGDEIVSECYSIFSGHGFEEMSIMTNPNYLRQGAATLIAKHYIGECFSYGSIPIWTCSAENEGSWKAALKVGFEIKRYYMHLVPKYGNVYSPVFDG